MDWTPSELERRHLAEQGQAVVANRRRGVDPNLIEWAKATGRSIDIGRPGPWGNPFVVGRDGTRAEVVAKHRAWLADQPGLLTRIPTLTGRVLCCWCHPEPCHADHLAALANAAPVPIMDTGVSPPDRCQRYPCVTSRRTVRSSGPPSALVTTGPPRVITAPGSPSSC